MRKIVIFLSLICCAALAQAAPTERTRIFAPGAGHVVTDDTVAPQKIQYVLSFDKPCEMPIADKKGMRAFTQFPHTGDMRRGCWYPTVDDGFVIIYWSGETSKQPTLDSLPRAKLDADGSATITEPEYDSNTFLKKVLDQQFRKRMEMREQGKY